MIYFIKDHTGPIKIGYTSKPIAQRLSALRTNTPNTLTVLKTMRGSQKDEKKLHEQFAHLRLYGEWFSPSAELLQFIETRPREDGNPYHEPAHEECMMSANSLTALKLIGDLVAVARKRRELSVSEMADRIGIDRRTLTQLEKGNYAVSLGIFIQSLDFLNLLNGLEEAIRPENDMEAIAISVYKVRRKIYSKKIDDSKVDF